jgi:hypothetical protein
MSISKENNYNITETDYIRYLYRECHYVGIHKSPDFYPALIKFVNSPIGQQTFFKFQQINPRKLGIDLSIPQHILHRAF